MKNPYNFPPEILEANRKIRKRNYKLIALVIVGLSIAVIAFVCLVSYGLKSTDAFKVAEQEIHKSSEIQTETGGIEDISLSTGSVSTHNNDGEASFDISVDGTKKDIDVSVYLTKYDGQWKVDELVW